MDSEGETRRGGTGDAGALASRRRSRFTLGKTWYLAAGILGAIVPFGLVAVHSGFDPMVIGLASGSLGVYAATLVGVTWFLRRRRRKRQEEALGMYVELDALRGDPSLVEQLRERVVSVGVIKIGDQDGGRYNDTTRELVQSFVITRDGENADIETHADSAHVIAGARWLAMALDVPLIDGRDSLHRSFSPGELEQVDDDLRVIESEAVSEADDRPTSPEIQNTSETSRPPSQGPGQKRSRAERSRRAEASRQRS